MLVQTFAPCALTFDTMPHLHTWWFQPLQLVLVVLFHSATGAKTILGTSTSRMQQPNAGTRLVLVVSKCLFSSEIFIHFWDLVKPEWQEGKPTDEYPYCTEGAMQLHIHFGKGHLSTIA